MTPSERMSRLQSADYRIRCLAARLQSERNAEAAMECRAVAEIIDSVRDDLDQGGVVVSLQRFLPLKFAR